MMSQLTRNGFESTLPITSHDWKAYEKTYTRLQVLRNVWPVRIVQAARDSVCARHETMQLLTNYYGAI